LGVERGSRVELNFCGKCSMERLSVLHTCKSDCMLLCLPSLQLVMKPSIFSCS
jgi:hypothetical protein